MTRAASMAVFIATAVTGCTAGEYDVAECDPAVASQADDVCNRLDPEQGASCQPFQCDAVAHRCVRKARDDDRDGEPARECGGTDCDDHDATVVGGMVASQPQLTVPAAADWTDPRLFVPYDTSTEEHRLAAVVRPMEASHCVRAYDLGEAVDAPASCTVLGSGVDELPHQVAVDSRGDVTAVAWIQTSGCANGIAKVATAASFAATSATAAAAMGTCDAGAAWPSIALAPAAPSSALLVWREESASAAVTPESTACNSAAPATIRAAMLDLDGDVSIMHTAVLGGSISTRPPAVLGLPYHDARFLVGFAGPTGGVRLVLFGDDLAPRVDTTIEDVPAAPSGLVLSVGAVDEETLVVGIGIEVGCAPSQAYFAAAHVDLAADSIEVSSALRVDDGQRAASVAPAWSSRGEWLVAWIAGTVEARRVRIDEQGEPVLVDLEPVRMPETGSAPVTLSALRSLERATDWNVDFYDRGAAPGFATTTIGCASR